MKGDVVRLVVLGLLNEGPKHGYSVYREIKHRFGASSNIKVGSVYHALRKLEETGEVEATCDEVENRRVYNITKKGRETFVKLLRKEFEKDYACIDPLRVVMVFFTALPVEEVLVFLRRKLDDLEEDLARVMRAREEMKSCKEVPWYAELVVQHSLNHHRAEIDWLRTVISALEKRACGNDNRPSRFSESLGASP